MTIPRVRAPRFEVEWTVVCEAGREVFSGTVVDMSESGMFVQTDRVLPLGASVMLFPNVSDEVRLPTEMKAQVVRLTDLRLEDVLAQTPGIAFRLVGLTVHDFSLVREFLRTNGRAKAKPAGKRRR